MDVYRHDPSEFVRGIQQILISDKKRIGFLFGAGTSMAQKNEHSLTIPGVEQMTKEVVKEIQSEKQDFAEPLKEMMDELDDHEKTIEHLLSNIEQKFRIIGGSNLNGLTGPQLGKLIDLIKEKVRKKVSIHKNNNGETINDESIDNLIHTDFAEWIGQAERKYPIEVFTINYDYLFELGMEKKRVPYYDGFSGSFRPFFNSESVEDLSFLPNQTKIWKVHGSLGWHFDPDSDRILRTNPDEKDILIYPSTLKYKDSKKQPYESLMDRLSSFLRQDDSILFTCGYSWNDEHINERIISALKTNTTSHVISLFYDKYRIDKENHYSLTPDCQLAKIASDNFKISVYGFRNAIIGCKYGEWVLRNEPDKNDTPQINEYFDEDAPLLEGEETTETWTGTGEFFLADFNKLVRFLKSMIRDNEIGIIGKNARK